MLSKILYLTVMVFMSTVLAVGCVSQAAGVTAVKATLPLLDTETPANVETAYFALG